MADARILSKALLLLDLIATSDGGRSAAELAELISVHRTNVYRYLNTFLDLGYIRKDHQDRYHLGNKILDLTSHLLGTMPLREAAHPCLVALSAKVQKTVHLCVLDGLDVIYIDKVESQRTLPIMSRIGSRAPAYCTAVGKVLLSALPAEQLTLMLGSIHFESRTPRTIVDPVRFLEEMKHTRSKGYALDDEEHEQGVICLATGVRDYGGECVGAISITGLKREYQEPEERDRLLGTLLQTAQAISSDLGFVA